MDIPSSPQVNQQTVAQVSFISKDHTSLQLTKGHVLEATVQRVADSLVWLNVGGEVFVARLEIPLQANQQIALEVADVTSTQIKLRLAGDTTGNQLQTTSPVFTHNLETQLMSWGLEADDVNLVITKTLLTHNQTLNPDDIETVRTLWRGLSPNLSLPATSGAETAAYLFARRLPVNNEAITLTHSYLNRLPDIVPQLTKLHTTLSQAYTKISSHTNPLLGQLGHLIESTLNQATGWIIPADAPPTEIAARLAKLIPSTGTSPEAELANHLSQIQKMSSGSVGEGGASPSIVIEPTSTAVSSSLSLSLSLPIPASGSASTVLPVTNPLHQLAAAITKVLDAISTGSLNIDQPEIETLNRLARQVDSLSNTLGALQLSNLAQSPNLTTDPYYTFSIPLVTPNGSHTAQLKVYRQLGHSTIDPNNLRLALLLDLPELGQMAINLTIHQAERYLSGQILSGREQTHYLANTELSKLQDQLVALGYRVGGLTAGLLEIDSPLTTMNDTPQIDSILSTQLNVEA
ncbi:MAG: hypothetical protein KDJ65_27200 [Anaerolineae bacterium]|nr:hypothetical protein [Anaerolineae bacterium]